MSNKESKKDMDECILPNVERLVKENEELQARIAMLEYQKHELDGVICDVEVGNGFDTVCLNTIKRVREILSNGNSTEWITKHDEEVEQQVLDQVRHFKQIRDERNELKKQFKEKVVPVIVDACQFADAMKIKQGNSWSEWDESVKVSLHGLLADDAQSEE